MKLNLNRSQVVIIWVAFTFFVAFSLFVILADGDGLIDGIVSMQDVLKPVAFFLSALTALIILTIGVTQNPPQVRWQNGFFRIYALWAVLSLVIVYLIATEERLDFVECLFPYAFIALIPWVIHVIAIWIIIPVSRWVHSGFSPHE